MPAFLLAAFKNKITEKKDSIFRLHPLIMFANDRLVHLLSRLKRPLAISDDIEVRKMII
jgi:hypothetical protein